MSRMVKRKFIDEWMKTRSPNAISKLSQVSKIPSQSIQKIRAGRVPKSELIRLSLARAVGVEEDDLFPFVTKDKRTKAS